MSDGSGDWTDRAADMVEQTVVLVRDRTVVPAQRGAKAVVYGLLAAFFGVTALMLLGILAFRLLTIPLPVWAAWLVLGGIFVLVGVFCWTRRAAPEEEAARV